jgi:hypothetical protein
MGQERNVRGSLAVLLPAVALSLLFFPHPRARADIVHLRNGSHVEGEVSPGSHPGSLKVTMDRGMELEFAEKDVQQVEPKKSPLKEFEERLAALPSEDIDGLLLLAEWCRERKLRSCEEKIYKRVLELDPNDPVARRELGFAVFKNRWVKEADLRNKHGLVQFRGDWMTPDEKERRLTEELEKEITELLRGVDSDNRYIREYSVKKLLEYRDPRACGVALRFLADTREAVRVVSAQLLASLSAPPPTSGPKAAAAGSGAGGGSHGSPAGKPARGESAGGKLTSAGQPGRQGGEGGARTGSRGAAKPAAKVGPSEEEVSRALLERFLAEESPAVRSSLAAAARKMRPRKFFELAVETMTGSDNALQRDRAAEGVLFALQKPWVPELIRALSKRPPGLDLRVGGNPAVRSILAKLSHEDFEYRLADWEAWWSKSQAHFAEED